MESDTGMKNAYKDMLESVKSQGMNLSGFLDDVLSEDGRGLKYAGKFMDMLINKTNTLFSEAIKKAWLKAGSGAVGKLAGSALALANFADLVAEGALLTIKFGTGIDLGLIKNNAYQVSVIWKSYDKNAEAAISMLADFNRDNYKDVINKLKHCTDVLEQLFALFKKGDDYGSGYWGSGEDHFSDAITQMRQTIQIYSETLDAMYAE